MVGNDEILWSERFGKGDDRMSCEKFEKGKFHSPPSGTVDNSPALQEQCEENA